MPFSIGLGAIGIGSLVGGLGSYFGAGQAADAQRDAARMQQEAALQALGLQRDMYNQTRSDLAPFRGLGLSAMQDYYRKLMAGGGDADLQRYQKEQTGLLNMQMAKRGLLSSGAAVKGLSDLGAKIAEAREQRFYDRMAPLLGVGTGTSNMLANASMGYARGGSDALTGGAQAAGNLYGQAGMNAGLGTSGLAGSIGGALGNGGLLYGLYNRPGVTPAVNPGVDAITSA